jgi:hypothetical protein
MPTLKKFHHYRLKKNKTGVDVIPIEDREVSVEIFNQFEDVEIEMKNYDRKTLSKGMAI